MPATSPGSLGASWPDIASVISITSCATCRWLWRALWKTQPFHGSKRDLRLHGSERDLHIKTLRRSETDPLIKKPIKTERANHLVCRKWRDRKAWQVSKIGDRRPTMTTPVWTWVSSSCSLTKPRDGSF